MKLAPSNNVKDLPGKRNETKQTLPTPNPLDTRMIFVFVQYQQPLALLVENTCFNLLQKWSVDSVMKDNF